MSPAVGRKPKSIFQQQALREKKNGDVFRLEDNAKCGRFLFYECSART